MPVDSGSLRAQYRVDSTKPVDCQTVPGFAVDVVVHAEEDRCGVAAPGGVMEAQRRVRVSHAAVEAAGEVRRGGSVRLAVLEVADDV